MHPPVFLSVGGKNDAEFAKAVHNHLGEALAYHYQVTGVEAVNFRSEIEGKLNQCNIFVAFWSNDYLKSEAALIELAYFRKVIESESISDRQIMIVSRSVDGPDIQGKWKNPITQKDEYTLGRWRNERAIGAEADANHVAQIIKRKLEHLKLIDDVFIPRGWITDRFNHELALPEYRTRELVFATGLEGDGRRTALRHFMRQSYAHRFEKLISMDSIDEPEDLLIKLMEVAAISASARDQIFSAIDQKNTTTNKEIRKILHHAREAKSYYVIAIDRFQGIDTVRIPIWLSDILSVFESGNAPIIFIVTSSPVTDALLEHYPNAGRVRVPGLEEEEMNQLVHRLVQEDSNPSRWTQEKKLAVAKTAGSSPALCKSIMRSMASEQTLDFVDKIAARAEHAFGQALAGLMAHWVDYYATRTSDLYALRVIEKLGVTSKDALEEILKPIVENHGPIDLYTLRDHGLVEQLSDGIYRIPPLIQRRLGDALWGKVSSHEIDAIFENFSRKFLVAQSEFGAIYASNAAAVFSRTNSETLAPQYEKYVTLITLFKAGLDRYSNKEWKLSHKIFQRAMARLLVESRSVDLATQVEIARYSGLAAVRASARNEVEAACSFLEEKFKKTKRHSSAKAMAKFVRGFEFRINRNFVEAIKKFKDALVILNGQRVSERQRAAIYTELAFAYLKSTPPKFEDALREAHAAFKEKDVNHTLNAYLQALVLYVFRSDKFFNEESIAEYLNEINDLMEKLKDRCPQGGKTFFDDRSREYQREYAAWQAKFTTSSKTQSNETTNNSHLFEVAELDLL